MPTMDQWRERWQTDNTQWDLAGVTPPLVNWTKTNRVDGNMILVPGCGRGYDAHFLSKRGADVTAIDLVSEAVEAAKAQHPKSRVKWEIADVIGLDRPNTYHRIWEYTCFCALEPDLREAYAANMAALLKPGGVYWGLVFSDGGHPQKGPPFPIAADDFRTVLEPHFTVSSLIRPAPDSVKSRRGSEIWFEAKRR